ncbi:hypothetical protein PV325_011363, partial [Microctonus aethiopoides]
DRERHFQRPDIIENVQNTDLPHFNEHRRKKKRDKVLFREWSVEKKPANESKFLHYSPYKSVCEEVRDADGTIVFKKRKINTSGALYEHYGYLKIKLRQQHLLEKVRSVEVVPEILRFTVGEQDAVEWLATHHVLKGVLGSDLLTWDFNNIYPNREDQFFDRWEMARDVIIDYLQDCKGLTGSDFGLYQALPALAQHNKDAPPTVITISSVNIHMVGE